MVSPLSPDSSGRRARQLVILLVWLILSLGPPGCRARSDQMKPTSTALSAPKAGLAQVVFIRPSLFAANQLVTILDGEGQFIGDSPSVSHFVVSLPPGTHRFVAWAENTTALVADLAANKTYFVEVALRAGAMSPRVVLLAQTPGTENFELVPTWLAQTERLAVSGGTMPESVANRSGDVTERLHAAAQELQDLESAELARRHLKPEDGLDGVPFAGLLPPKSRPPASAAAGESPTIPTSAGRGPPTDSATAATPSSQDAPVPSGRRGACRNHGDCTDGRLCISGGCSLAVSCSGDDAECPSATRCREGVCQP